MSRTKGLEDLQTIDLQAAQAAARLARVESALADDRPLVDAEAAQSAAAAQQRASQQALKDVQGERSALKARITTEERRLYDGSATSPKELQGLQHEVEALRRRLGGLDDVALTRMLEVDAANAAAKDAQAALIAVEQDAATRQAAQLAERDKLQAALTHLARARQRHAPAVAADDLALYEALRQRVGVKVLATVNDEHCGACGIHLPRHQLDDALRQRELATCGHCGRILIL